MHTVVKKQVKIFTVFYGSVHEDGLEWLRDVEEIFGRVQIRSSNKFLAIQSYLSKYTAKWFAFNRSSISN